MMNRLVLLFSALISLSSCQKEDTAVILPPPGPVETMTTVLGPDYLNQVYVSLGSHSAVSRSYNAYDLTFETADTGSYIWLNGGKLMFACRTGSYDMATADSVGKEWRVDNEQLNRDSAATGKWWMSLQDGHSEVFIIDRGKTEHTGADRWRKFQVVNVNSEKYTVRFSNYDNSNYREMEIPRDTMYSLMYLSFSGNGNLVQQAPAKDQWDFVFTKYTHVYFQFDPTSIFRNYPVTGALINIWNNTSGTLLQRDSTAGFVEFDNLTYQNALTFNFSSNADVIGFDWKFYDFNTSQYTIRNNRYYILKDHEGVYYKLRMVDYYDASGNKGTVTFQYQRL